MNDLVGRLRKLCFPVGKPFIQMRPDSLALENAAMTSREKEQICAAWNALPELLDRIEQLEAPKHNDVTEDFPGELP